MFGSLVLAGALLCASGSSAKAQIIAPVYPPVAPAYGVVAAPYYAPVTPGYYVSVRQYWGPGVYYRRPFGYYGRPFGPRYFPGYGPYVYGPRWY